MVSSRATLASHLALLLLISGCGTEQGTDDQTPEVGGTAQIRFMVTNTVRESRNLKDPLLGNIYGALFLASEVTLTGPIEGATDLDASIELEGIDLRSMDTSTASWTSKRLLPESYIFLGFYDVDGNGADTMDPDPGDPVTLPINAFTIEDGQMTPHVVTFDFVFN